MGILDPSWGFDEGRALRERQTLTRQAEATSFCTVGSRSGTSTAVGSRASVKRSGGGSFLALQPNSRFGHGNLRLEFKST
jgi:hypothetical protein